MIAPRTARQKRRPKAQFRAKNRGFLAFFAWLVVGLQLVTALHFALVPHAFSAQLTSFVHEHARAEHGSESSHLPAPVAHLHQGSPLCAADSCPLGFAGPSVLELAPFELIAASPAALPSAAPALSTYVPARARLLLSAPKTSPPV